MIDTTGWTRDDYVTALQTLQIELRDIDEAVADDAQRRRDGLDALLADLRALRGQRDTPPGTDSIRAVLGYDGTTMADNAHLALPLAFTGLDILTGALIDALTIINTDR